MECYKCHKKLTQHKSKFGFYYYCSNCGKIFETNGQQIYNSNKFTNRADHKKNNESFKEADNKNF